MKVIIDRFEGEFAVVELNDGRHFENLPLALVPSGAKEGDVLNISIDKGATESRREHIQGMLDILFDNNRPEQ
ncbi:MAG TPA: DUF3006 domain-containing protein [Candidatus Monoglobus merdigallinarum]|uniref:DUF3006 domain-containing protein n=1 Tax=Candidatus Monoglobus merdigallinarum TaxID=2838698 RepID=A0A9D1PSE3_9FIRM|nr:DUF3006 domain-containing protein [Candidatus Monoglobus merdigallinarum]